MSHDPSFPERALMSGKEVPVRDVVRERYPDTAKASADAEEAVKSFFDALLHPPPGCLTAQLPSSELRARRGWRRLF